MPILNSVQDAADWLSSLSFPPTHTGNWYDARIQAIRHYAGSFKRHNQIALATYYILIQMETFVKVCQYKHLVCTEARFELHFEHYARQWGKWPYQQPTPWEYQILVAYMQLIFSQRCLGSRAYRDMKALRDFIVYHDQHVGSKFRREYTQMLIELQENDMYKAAKWWFHQSEEGREQWQGLFA